MIKSKLISQFSLNLSLKNIDNEDEEEKLISNVENSKALSIPNDFHYLNETEITPDMFKIEKSIGKGAFGKVFLVTMKTTGKQYAMKVLNKKEIIKNRLIRYAVTEKNVVTKIEHPFIVRCYFSFQTKDRLYMILEYCPNGNLGDLLDNVNNLSEDHTKMYAAEILLALEELHKHDIIYRDLKPDNIVIDEEGHAKLTDFGLSKEGVRDDKITMSF